MKYPGSYGRTRKYGKLTNSEDIVEIHYPKSCANRIWEETFRATGFQVGRTVRTDDVVIKGFERRKAKGEMFFNKFMKSDYEAQIFGSANLTYTTVGLACGGPATPGIYKDTGPVLTYLVGLAQPDNVLGDDRVGRVSLECEAKLVANRLQGQTNLIESLAEVNKLWGTLVGPLENISKFVRDFKRIGKRRFSVKNGVKILGTIYHFTRTEWLRFRYGLTPLMRDATAIMKAMTKGHPKRAIRVSSRAQMEVSQTSSTTSNYTNSVVNLTYQTTKSDTFSIRSVLYDEYRPTVFSDLGVTLRNVAAVGWELTHLSFVLDWLANVGDFIYGNIPVASASFIGGSTTITRTQRAVNSPISFVNASPGTWASVVGTLDSNMTVLKTVTRLPFFDVPSPSFVVRDDFRFSNWVRCADAIALIPAILNLFSFHTDPNWKFDDSYH